MIEDLFSVKGKRALVTGGSFGIGAMICEGLLRAGAQVIVCSRKQNQLDAFQEKMSEVGNIETFAADLSTDEGISSLANYINMSAGLDILVNNAGRTWGAPIDEFAREGFEKVLALNLIAPFELTKKLLPSLRKSATKLNPARVINIASVDGLKNPHWESYSYSSSKSGLLALTRHLGKFLAKENISVNAIAPGFFPSKMTASIVDLDDAEKLEPVLSKLGARVGTLEDIAGAVIYLSSRAGAWLSGVTIEVAGGTATID